LSRKQIRHSEDEPHKQPGTNPLSNIIEAMARHTTGGCSICLRIKVSLLGFEPSLE
jgi:nucleoside permease NupC